MCDGVFNSTEKGYGFLLQYTEHPSSLSRNHYFVVYFLSFSQTQPSRRISALYHSSQVIPVPPECCSRLHSCHLRNAERLSRDLFACLKLDSYQPNPETSRLLWRQTQLRRHLCYLPVQGFKPHPRYHEREGLVQHLKYGSELAGFTSGRSCLTTPSSNSQPFISVCKVIRISPNR
jgi:hypothetical protein